MSAARAGEGTVERSARACPVCGEHALAIDRPPAIDVLGVQPFSDLVGMGDRQPGGMPGIVCLACGTRWRDLAAFEAGEAEPAGGEAEPAGGEAEPGAEIEATSDATRFDEPGQTSDAAANDRTRP